MHIKSVHETWIFSCEKCTQKFNRKCNMIRHSKLKHSNQSRSIYNKSKTEVYKKELKKNKSDLTCEICKKVFVYNKSFQAHIQICYKEFMH